MKKFRRLILGLALLAAAQFGIPMEVSAADGNLSIAVTSTTVEQGDTVTVILDATGPNGEKAWADMEFTYNSDVFSFVSCDSANYSGGAGGQVDFSGTTVKVTLKAAAPGSCKLLLYGKNGAVADTGEALTNMTAAGATISASGGTGTDNHAGSNTDSNTDTGADTDPVGSADNSLAELSLSVGELSPAFSYSQTQYTAEVPYETESVEVHTMANHGRAKVTDISGNEELQVGENTISVTVQAENGSKAVYKIVVTRAAQPDGTAEGDNPADGTADGAGTPGTGEDVPVAQEEMDSQMVEEQAQQLTYLREEYQKLDERYRAEKAFSRKVIAILIFVIVVLLLTCVNLFLFMKRGNGVQDKEILEERKHLKRVREAEAKAVKKAKKKKAVPEDDDEDWLDEDMPEEETELPAKETELPAKEQPTGKKEKKPSEIEFIDLDDF